MKTIKTILVAITVAFTFYACSESIYYPPESENNKYLYTLEEYYEPTVTINANTTEDDISQFYKGYDYMGLGRIAFVNTTINYETLDTLVIDGTNMDNIKKLIFMNEYDTPNKFTHKYKIINYLKITNFTKELSYFFNPSYGNIRIGNSNISLEELNTNSITINGVRKPAFEKITLVKNKETYIVDLDNEDAYSSSGFKKFIGKQIGFVDYITFDRTGKKYKLISIEKQ